MVILVLVMFNHLRNTIDLYTYYHYLQLAKMENFIWVMLMC